MTETDRSKNDSRTRSFQDRANARYARRQRHRRWGRPIAAIATATGMLLFGYGDLWNGGSTVSALMLTVGYLIMVPIAIITMPREDSELEK